MYILLRFLGLLASLALSFISSGMETALYRVSRVRMRIRSEQGEARAGMVISSLDRMDAVVTTILIDNNIAAYTGTYFLSTQLALWAVPHAELATTAIITPLFFVLTESLPKQLAYSKADRWALELVRVFAVLRTLLSPMVIVLNRISAALRRLLGSSGEANLSQSQRALLLEHLNAGVADHVLTEEQSRMAGRIMELEGIGAGDSMVPLRRLHLLSALATRRRAVAEMSRRGTRAALLIDSQGRPTGQLLTMNALIMSPGPADAPIESVAERPDMIRAAVAIPEVLNLFRTRHARHALVVDRNRIVGLITTQSVLDRIAGIAR